MGKVIIFSAPSGSGKSTIVNELLQRIPSLEFSVSATSRLARGQEKDGVEYYFFSNEEFQRRVAADEFLEWEEVYPGTSYGTLKSVIEQIWNRGNVVVFDVDVVGGVKLKKLFAEQAASIFIMPPSVEELRRRLLHRATDSVEAIEKRVGKAAREIEYAPQFDFVVVNDDLDKAVDQTQQIITQFIG